MIKILHQITAFILIFAFLIMLAVSLILGLSGSISFYEMWVGLGAGFGFYAAAWEYARLGGLE